VVLVLVTVMVVPGTALAADTTVVTGSVEGGYEFVAPDTIDLGSMFPSGTPYTGGGIWHGSLVGNNPAGYTVTGIDAKATDTGYMTTSGGTPLANKLEISDDEYTGFVTADVGKTWVDSSGPTNTVIDLYVSQLVDYTDEPGDYSIEITFTVTEKT
jgi:hypothetical protein